VRSESIRAAFILEATLGDGRSAMMKFRDDYDHTRIAGNQSTFSGVIAQLGKERKGRELSDEESWDLVDSWHQYFTEKEIVDKFIEWWGVVEGAYADDIFIQNNMFWYKDDWKNYNDGKP
jgi:hypothetical protein